VYDILLSDKYNQSYIKKNVLAVRKISIFKILSTKIISFQQTTVRINLCQKSNPWTWRTT